MEQLPDSFMVGDWLVEPTLLRMTRNGEVKKVEPQVMAVLEYLVAHAGQVVTKENLMDTIWKEVIVTENVLTRAISSLRKVLGDDRFNPKYIETISKTGYRLIAKVELEPQAAVNDSWEIPRKSLMMALSVLLVLILGGFAASSVFNNSSKKMYHPVAVANYSNSEYWPSISPDGKFVAYSWRGENNDNWDVYAKLIGTESTMRITESPSTDLRARWSPDGNYIYFLRYENGGTTIYKKSLVGEKEIRVIRTPRYSYGDFDVSPDEKWISFNDRENSSSPLRLKLISLETGEEQWLTKPEDGFKGDIHPTFSTNGKHLAFIREKNAASMQLWLIDLKSKGTKQLTSNHISINGFDWSHQAKSIIYGSDQSGLYKLWEVNVANKETNLIPAGDYQMVMPRVAETGRMVYSKMKDNINIWSYHLERKTAEPWLSTNDLNLNPVISPDGNKVCYTMNKEGVFQIWVSSIDGSKKIPITNFTGEYLNTPRWSPDGENIVFQGFLKGQADIYLVNAHGGVPKNLTKSKSDDHSPYFSQDNHIYFSSNRNGEWGIWKMDANGKNEQLIIANNAYAPQLSNEDRVIFYSKKGELGLWAYHLENDIEQLIIEEFHPMYWGAFTIGEDGIYYLNAKNKRFEYYNFNTKESELIYRPRARIPRMGITLHLSPDSQFLLFSQIDNNDADIMLLE